MPQTALEAFIKGTEQNKNSQFKEALTSFELALNGFVEPKRIAYCHYHIGLNLEALANYEEAISHYTKSFQFPDIKLNELAQTHYNKCLQILVSLNTNNNEDLLRLSASSNGTSSPGSSITANQTTPEPGYTTPPPLQNYQPVLFTSKASPGTPQPSPIKANTPPRQKSG
jgi:tetratricopeptide (TPR) repeat protein